MPRKLAHTIHGSTRILVMPPLLMRTAMAVSVTTAAAKPFSLLGRERRLIHLASNAKTAE